MSAHAADRGSPRRWTVVMPRGVESLWSLLAGSVSAQESSFQVRAATHTMAMVVATSMTEKYR
jgi:hypothetical protein